MIQRTRVNAVLILSVRALQFGVQHGASYGALWYVSRLSGSSPAPFCQCSCKPICRPADAALLCPAGPVAQPLMPSRHSRVEWR